MYCAICGQQTDDKGYCGSCGSTTMTNVVKPDAQSTPPTKTQVHSLVNDRTPVEAKESFTAVYALAFALLVLVVGLVIWLMTENSKQTSAQSGVISAPQSSQSGKNLDRSLAAQKIQQSNLLSKTQTSSIRVYHQEVHNGEPCSMNDVDKYRHKSEMALQSLGLVEYRMNPNINPFYHSIACQPVLTQAGINQSATWKKVKWCPPDDGADCWEIIIATRQFLGVSADVRTHCLKS